MQRDAEGGELLVRIRRAYSQRHGGARYHVGSAAAPLTQTTTARGGTSVWGRLPQGRDGARAARRGDYPNLRPRDAMPHDGRAHRWRRSHCSRTRTARAAGRREEGGAFGNVAGTNATHLCETVFDADGTPTCRRATQ